MPRNLPDELANAAALRRRWRVTEALIICARVLILALGGCVAIDALVRFPTPLRWAMLGGLLWCGVWLWRKRVAPALRSSESVVKLALLLERVIPGGTGRIASGVEFSLVKATPTNTFALSVANTACELTPSTAVASLIESRPARREGAQLLGVAAIWATFALLSPNLAVTGLTRICAPWADADWPARTNVRSKTFVTHHPKRTTLALKADLFRGDPTSEPVWVKMRTRDDGVAGPWESFPMVHQGETLFERLVDPAADAVEFQFLTRDMETPPQVIELVEAPRVVSVVATITPPTYSSASKEVFELGRATGGRGRVPKPVLEGAVVEVLVKTDPTLPLPTTGSAEYQTWVERTLLWSGMPKGVLGPPQTLTLRDGGEGWSVAWVADTSRTITMRITDAHGVSSVDESSVIVDVVRDAAAEATILQPLRDETVLETAVVSIKGEARDDVGVAWTLLRASRGKEWTQELSRVEGGGVMEVIVEADFDLAQAKASPGDVFELTCEALDEFTGAGTQRPPTISQPRRLRVLTRVEFDEETRNALAAVRQSSLMVDERQKSLIDMGDAPRKQLRAQAEIGERLESLKTATESLQSRMDRNRIDDPALRSLLSAAADILSEARAQSDEARDSLQRGADASENTESQQKEIADAKDSQENVHSELEDLAALLDRDKDVWAATKALERVAEAITRADDERNKAGLKTIGRTQEELDEEEKASLESAAQAAQQAAQAAEEVVEEMEDVAKADPERAADLKAATDRAARESLTARMEQAEQATRENRLDEARQASASAMKTVKQMMEDLAEDEKSRTETLRRRLASLAEALEGLVREAASAEASGLDLVAADGDRVADTAKALGREAANLSLSATGIAEEGRAVGPEAQRVVRLVERGAETEGGAAAALLVVPPSVKAGHEALARSTVLFKEALEAAQTQEKRAEEAEKQERARELARAYQALCERQESVVTASNALVSNNPDRRALVEARRLAVSEEEIRVAIGAVADGSEDVRNSPTFMEATSIAMEAASGAISDLKGGPPTEATLDLEREVLTTLRGLAQALEQASKKRDDPFSDPQTESGGGGGGGGSQEEPLIPPIAELKVLRAMQSSVYEKTKRLAESGGSPIALESLAKRQEGIARLAEQLRDAVEKRQEQKAQKNEEDESVPIIVPPDEGEQP